MTNELAIQYTYEQLKDQAAIAVKSGLFPGKTAEAALVIMLKGRELGVGPMQALEGINVISGKAAVSPQLMLALIYARHPGATVEIVSTPEGCSVTMARKDGIPHVETFGPKEAAAMGLAGKDNYKKQAATMYKWRAISACARVVFPDVIQGMYTVEELAPDTQVDFEGEVIQQHVDIDTDMRQVAPPSPQDAISGAQPAQGGQVDIQDEMARQLGFGPETEIKPTKQIESAIPAFPTLDAWIPSLDGKALYALQQEGWKHAGMDNVVHFKNRWRKIYKPARAIIEIQSTVGDFIERMKQPSEEFEPAGPDVADGDNMPGN